MKRIIASRGTGKSTELLKMAMREQGSIAVPCKACVRHFIDIANEIGVDQSDIRLIPEGAVIAGVTIAPFHNFMERAPSSDFSRRNKVFVDEIELCVKMLLCRYDLEGYTISLEDIGDFK